MVNRTKTERSTVRLMRMSFIVRLVQSRRRQATHWLATHVLGFHFCAICCGYFHDTCMRLPDVCETCHVH